ncbi:porin family protein [Chitinophaga sp. CF418]|uniref:porin family protein n=1 Tax=Chitinophaga sp. CF418 TaxID=1855287 RepID=UPI00091B2EDF|nr:porin family protein [Chitinophaga sp. CF418]SHN43271.1 hypothetical protein SAMN05216311_115195 [Chitinophaga sp. CF418]
MICVLLSTGVKAQTNPPSLDKQVRVPLKEVNITTLGDMITAQTGFILSFNAQTIIAQKQLLLRHPSYSIHQLLTIIKEATSSEYTIIQDHVIFRRVKNKGVVTRTATTSHTTKQEIGQRLAGINRPPVATAGKQIHITVTPKAGHIAYHHNTTPLPHMGRTAGQTKNRTGLKAAVPSGRSSNKNNNIHQNIITNKETGIKTDNTSSAPTTAPTTDITVQLIPDTTRAVTKTGIVMELIPDNMSAANNTGITADATTGTTSAAPINVIAGNSKAAGNSLAYIGPLRITIPTIKPAAPALLQVTPPAKRQKERYVYEKPGLFKPFVQAGFAADEALYANLQAKAGITLAYGIVSWSTNFSVSGFRYGAGISYPLNNGWLIELEATTGKLFKETPVRMNDDTTTTKPPLYANSRLQRISLFAQKSIGPHLSVYAGPVFNHLKSTYQLRTWPLNLASLRVIVSTPEEDYVTISPLYTLHRSPAEETEDIMTWIGFQIGISYRL